MAKVTGHLRRWSFFRIKLCGVVSSQSIAPIILIVFEVEFCCFYKFENDVLGRVIVTMPDCSGARSLLNLVQCVSRVLIILSKTLPRQLRRAIGRYDFVKLGSLSFLGIRMMVAVFHWEGT